MFHNEIMLHNEIMTIEANENTRIKRESILHA